MLRGLFGRRGEAATPIVLCIDVEPDDREVGEAPATDGIEATFARVVATRDRLERATGSPAKLNWFIRADPQIAAAGGDAGWLYRDFAAPIAAADRAGDEVGLHVHAWRRDPDGWLADHGDPAWVADCVELGLRTFSDLRGGPPPTYRGATASSPRR